MFRSSELYELILTCKQKKISGADRSVNIVVGPDGFTSSGTKTFTKTADSGKKIVSHFCGDCGSTLFREAEAFGPAKIIKAGTLDGGASVIESAKPDAELFAPERPSWVSQVPGSAEKSGMS